MRTLPIILTLLFAAILTGCGPSMNKISDSSSDKGFIPKDLEECFTQIDRILPDSIKQARLTQTEDQFSSRMHMGLGLWIRNNWGLWKGSRLSKYFNEKGINHPDDMSGIILDSYYRKKAGKEIKLEEQIIFYQNYWKVVKKPTKEKFPKGVSGLESNSGMYYDSRRNGKGFVHVGTSAKRDDIWIYDYHFGWAKVSEADKKKIEQSVKNREEVLIEIYQRTKQ